MHAWSLGSADWASTGMAVNAARGQLIFFFLAPPAPENLASRDGFGVPPRASALIDSTPRLNLVLTHELPPLSPAFHD